MRELEKAMAMTARAFDDVMRELHRLTKEREVEASSSPARASKATTPASGTVAAAGPNACTLHWTRNDGPLRRGDLLLLDAGVEAESLYTADVTRTVPIGGRSPSCSATSRARASKHKRKLARRVQARQRLPLPNAACDARARVRAERLGTAWAAPRKRSAKEY